MGIDLGDTYSRAGVYENNSVHLVVDEQGFNSTPSYVSYVENNVLVGKAAFDQTLMNPGMTFHNVRSVPHQQPISIATIITI